MEETKRIIRGFFSHFFTVANLRDEDDIFQLGFVNSMFAIQLVAFIEKEFDIVVDDEDLDIENFNSVNALAGFIGRKGAGAVSSAD
ncbi:MAG TPA: phosphopantetheine-binding protein [Blastocatellia bacterium]|nr:phosphopantetheine-binding protein [Blastocatellia bacterium]